MTDRVLGYVVIEWDQARGLPEIATQDMCSERDAKWWADDASLRARGHGRKERYTIAQVIEVEE